MNAPCGLTYAARLRTTSVRSDWESGKTKKNYYDEDALTGLFGATASERQEQMDAETEGVGFATQAELASDQGDIISEHFLRTHPDWGDFDSPEAPSQVSIAD